MTVIAADAPVAPAEMSQGRAFLCVLVLTAAWSLNMLDRQLMAIVAAPIKNEPTLRAPQPGLLTGLTLAPSIALLQRMATPAPAPAPRP